MRTARGSFSRLSNQHIDILTKPKSQYNTFVVYIVILNSGMLNSDTILVQ